LTHEIVFPKTEPGILAASLQNVSCKLRNILKQSSVSAGTSYALKHNLFFFATGKVSPNGISAKCPSFLAWDCNDSYDRYNPNQNCKL
jgi:hypothetical protein